MTRNEIVNSHLRRIATMGALGLILSLGFAGTAIGQKSVEFEFGAISGIGLGELGEGINRAAWGISVYGGKPLRGIPFSLGLRLAMANYGSERNPDLAGYSPSFPAGVKYKYNLLLTHVVFRWQPRQRFLTPHLEALAGIHCFLTQAYTGTRSSVPIIAGDAIFVVDENESETLLSGVAPSVGLGGGLKLRLARFGAGRRASGSPLTLFLELQGRYLLGGPARYLKPGGLSFDGDRLIQDRQRTHTNMFCYSIGVSLQRTPRDR